jgi:cyclophilin family peptidyl-prolyl cis-trans isomerase
MSSESLPVMIYFKNTSTDANEYLWSFDDGQTSARENPNHEFLKSGHYKVKLIAKRKSKESITTHSFFLPAPENCLILIRTSEGDVVVELYENTPKHLENFIALSERGYYNGTLFHRVINGFMIQGGDPDSRNAKAGQQLGVGGPTYTIPAEINAANFHVKGALAAARQSDAANPQKSSSGSQFYVVHGRSTSEEQLKNHELEKGIRYPEEVKSQYLENGGTPFLDMEYTVFGRVLEGMEVIDKIAASPTDTNDRPLEDVLILETIVIK